MIRAFFVDFVFPLLLFLVLRAALRNLSAPSRSSPAENPSNHSAPVQPAGELKKDPVCGTYVSTAASITQTVNGKVLHFCSKECRDKYRVA